MKKLTFFVFFFFLSVSASAREFNIKVGPGLGYLGGLDDTAYNVKIFPDIMADLSLSIEATRHLYPMLETSYMHSSRKGAFFSGGMDLFGISPGVIWMVKPGDYQPETGDALDRSRYWFSLAPGAYITKISSSTAGTNAGTTKIDFGFSTGVGVDYYFLPNVGIGGRLKFTYVMYSDSYLILNIGPSLCVRF